jgi:formylglycine-generating enzyme required for sulfatase activity
MISHPLYTLTPQARQGALPSRAQALHCTHPSPGMPGHAVLPMGQAFVPRDVSLLPLHPPSPGICRDRFLFPWLCGALTLVLFLLCVLGEPLQAVVDHPREITARDGAPMVFVPAGEFSMGLPEGEGLDDEQPRHSVYLDAFYIDKFEVTTERYARFLAVSGWDKPVNWDKVKFPDHGDRPVIGVSWGDADAYCQIGGRRLPTEAEWERAARNEDERKFPWGDLRPSSSLALFGQGTQFSYDLLKPVGSYAKGQGAYGTFDQAGNVAEWVQDWYDGEYYRESPLRNPLGPLRGQYKVTRGGSWSDMPVYLLSASRTTKLLPETRNAFVGFRCAQSAPR